MAETDKVKVKIVPQKVKLNWVKAKSGKKAKISWKKLKNVSGYEIYYATSEKGKYKKLTTVTKASKVSYTSKAMKKSGKYYFKVRAYKKVNGKKVYGDYSNIKSAKIK